MKYGLQHIDINSSTDNFYCPVTGQQLLHPEYFDPSSALIFNYFDDYKEFDEATPEIRKLYEESLEESGTENQLNLKPFQVLINEKLKKYRDRYLLIEMGDIFNNHFYCFDLLYNPKNKVIKVENKESAYIPTGLEANFILEINELYCPATGHKIVDESTFNTSPALEFIYCHSKKEFEVINKDFENLIREKFNHSVNQKLSELDYSEIVSYLLNGENKHFLLTYGTSGKEISVCVDMSD